MVTKDTPLQLRITEWGTKVFGSSYTHDDRERCRRFIEEAIELVQAVDVLTSQEIHAVVDYVLARPPGEVAQEVAGSLLTLAALSDSMSVDMMAAAEEELEDLNTPERTKRVLLKQQQKFEAGVGDRFKADSFPARDAWQSAVEKILKETKSTFGLSAENVPSSETHEHHEGRVRFVQKAAERIVLLEAVLNNRWIPFAEMKPPVQRVIDHKGEVAELCSSANVLAMSLHHTCDGSFQHVAIDAYRPGSKWLDRTEARIPYTHWQPIVLPAVKR